MIIIAYILIVIRCLQIVKSANTYYVYVRVHECILRHDQNLLHNSTSVMQINANIKEKYHEHFQLI